MILTILLSILLILQLISLIQLIYTNHKRFKQDELFWDSMIESNNLLNKNLEDLSLGEGVSKDEYIEESETKNL